MALSIIQIISYAFAIVGLPATIYQIARPTPNRRAALFFGIFTLISLLCCTAIFLNSHTRGTVQPPVAVSPTPSPSPPSGVYHLNPETYRTQFLHSQTMEDAEWFVDGVKTAPVDPPLPSFTVLLLSRGQHQILAKTVGNICSVRITVPVSEQGVTLKCHSD